MHVSGEEYANCNARYIRNQQGGAKLKDALSYHYFRDYEIENKTMTSWRCTDKGCHVRVRTPYGYPHITAYNNATHTHQPPPTSVK